MQRSLQFWNIHTTKTPSFISVSPIGCSQCYCYPNRGYCTNNSLDASSKETQIMIFVTFCRMYLMTLTIYSSFDTFFWNCRHPLHALGPEWVCYPASLQLWVISPFPKCDFPNFLGYRAGRAVLKGIFILGPKIFHREERLSCCVEKTTWSGARHGSRMYQVQLCLILVYPSSLLKEAIL